MDKWWRTLRLSAGHGTYSKHYCWKKSQSVQPAAWRLEKSKSETIYTFHCGTFKHVGGHELLNAFPFFSRCSNLTTPNVCLCLVHCGTFKHVGGHKLLKACPFFVSWQIKKSKLPKDYLHRKGSLGGCGQFFPPPPPPQNCPLSTKINFWHCSGWKKNCPQVEFNAQ